MAKRILGREQLKRKLRALPKAATDELRKAMARSADEIVALARALVPVDQGDLRDSIGWVWGRKAPKGSLSLGTVESGVEGSNLVITVYAGNDEAFYARWVEFGTAPHAVGSGSDLSSKKGKQYGQMHPGAKASPFFFPAYRTLKKRIKNRHTRAVNKVSRQIAAQG